MSAPTGELLGVPLALCTRAELLDELTAAVRAPRSAGPFTAYYLNAHALLTAQDDPAYRAALRAASLVYADGMGVVLAGRALGLAVPAKHTTTDVFPEFCDVAAREGWRLFLLGAHSGVAERAAQRLTLGRPGLPPIAVRDGFWEPGGDEAVLDAVLAARPHVLVVCRGLPGQELWVERYRARLAAVPLVLTGGGLLDFLSGATPRGPRWMTDHGLEWLARLGAEPARLGRRYLAGLPRLAWLVARERWRRRRRGW